MSTEDREHTRSNMTGIAQTLVSAILVAISLWVGNTLYQFSNLIAVNIDKTETIIQRIEKIEDHLEDERKARIELQLEMERRMHR